MTAPRLGAMVQRLDPSHDLPRGLQAVADALLALPEAPGRLRRIETPLNRDVDPMDLPAGLPAGLLDPVMLLGRTWSGAGATLEHEAGSLADLDDPTTLLAGHGWPAGAPELRLALSARFDQDRDAASEWSAFGACRVWLPTVELDSDAGVLAINWIDGPGRSRRAVADALLAWRPHAGHTPSPLTWRVDNRARARWCAQVDRALARIADRDTLPPLSKIVLARRLDGDAGEAIRAVDLLRARGAGSVGWPWLLRRGEAAWLGESPEQLGVRNGRSLRTVALAGTRLRGADADADRALELELLGSDKDRREQATVADWIGGRLERITGRRPSTGPLQVVKLPSLQHLGRRLEVALDDGAPDRAWLEALHPTPALCGAPRVDVRRWLRNAEDFDRGLYGGVLGWLQPSRAEMYVTIRGALVCDRRVSVYAGAGVVEGSVPEAEWAETGAKLAAVCRRLGLAPTPSEEPS